MGLHLNVLGLRRTNLSSRPIVLNPHPLILGLGLIALVLRPILSSFHSFRCSLHRIHKGLRRIVFGLCRVVIGSQCYLAQHVQVMAYHAIIGWFTGSPPADVPGYEEGMSLSLLGELDAAESLSEETGEVVGHYTEQVPTSLVYLVPEGLGSGDPWPGLPDHSSDSNIVDPFEI